MTEPTRLTREQLAPIATAIHRREAARYIGMGVKLPPFPDCPTCGQAPTELIAGGAHHTDFVEARVRFGFRPCGHTFTADGEDLYLAYEAARAETT